MASHSRISVCLVALLSLGGLSGCASSGPTGVDRGPTHTGPTLGPRARAIHPDQQIAREAEAERKAADEIRRLREGERNRAYAAGVQDTMEEFRGRIHGQRGFVYEPPVIERVQMPAAVRNGALIPAHEASVIVSPGRWIEQNNVGMPVGPAPSANQGKVEFFDE